MVSLTAENIEQLRETLQDAVVKCSERCLYQSAKWIAELLNSLPSSDPESLSDTDDDDSQMLNAEPTAPPPPIVLTSNLDPQEARLEAQEAHKYLLAKSYFDCREYDRCSAVFLPSTLPQGPISDSPPPMSKLRSPPSTKKGKSKATNFDPQAPMAPPNSFPRLSQKALFLALYAKYLSGEKRKDEDSEMILGPADGSSSMNKELVNLSRGLEGWFAERMGSGRGGLEESGQGWLEYLYGIVLAKGKNEEEAKKWLVRSVHLYPYNWGAWLELSELLGSAEELNRIVPDLPTNIMTLIFHLYTSQELYQSNDSIHSQLSQLEAMFPESQFLKTQRALLFYHSKHFEEAEAIFSSLIQQDPHRIDSLDHYSNILYVMSLRPKLAFLAQLATATDKFRPETCCVVGNYYSLKSEHEKAVMYFRRALTLDRSFLSAWTLMGHEYVEMKNTHAAIESYRRAVDVNRKDYRAWYGLGQTYEVLEMHFYALFYYQRAAGLRPYDPKMWQAVASCFNKMGRPIQSIKAHKRALVAGTYYEAGSTSFGSSTAAGPQALNPVAAVLDPETLYQIALMYEKIGDLEQAASYMELTLAQEDGPLLPAPSSPVLASSPAATAAATAARAPSSSLPPPSSASGRESSYDHPAAAAASASASAGVGAPPHGFIPGVQQGTGGVGVTATTSKARMWLARWETSRGGYYSGGGGASGTDNELNGTTSGAAKEAMRHWYRAMELANELCQDGVEVEEAKALVRELRARIEGAGG
ncbi:MAG: hypothetical protein M1819_006886 [Sarea resinae]|nr:MAG: hypothetical protein M1819_006886 [Sarea resinae]